MQKLTESLTSRLLPHINVYCSVLVVYCMIIVFSNALVRTGYEHDAMVKDFFAEKYLRKKYVNKHKDNRILFLYFCLLTGAVIER